MSRYSVKTKGKWETLYFRHKTKHKNSVYGDSNSYSLYLGDRYIGEVYDMHRDWTAVVCHAGDMNLVDGFARRETAAFYIVNYLRSVGEIDD